MAVQAVVAQEVDEPTRGVTQPGGVLQDRVQDRIKIEWRATERLQDVAQRRLICRGVSVSATRSALPSIVG